MAYHGTKAEHVRGILDVGEIVPAGGRAMGKDIHEGSKHFNDDWAPEGFDTKQVFLSPSIRYSGVDAYAKPSKYDQNNDVTREQTIHWLLFLFRFCKRENGSEAASYTAKAAFKVFIKPGCYKVGEQTIGATSKIDPEFSNQELEWSTKERGVVILNSIVVKLKPNSN